MKNAKTPHPSHSPILPRVRRIEGQLRGVSRMIEERRYCIDILQQLNAVRRATEEVSLRLMRGHIDHCVTHAVRHKNGHQKVDELMETIHRFVR